MQTSRLIRDEDVKAAIEHCTKLEPRPALVWLERDEPVLAQHVWDGMDIIWDKLRQYGLITPQGKNPIDETLHPTILGLVVSSVEAARSGHRNAIAELIRHQRLTMDSAPQAFVSEALLEDVETAYWSLDSKRSMMLLAELEPVLARFVKRVTSSVLDSLDVAVDYQVSWYLERLVVNQIQTMGAVCVEALHRRDGTGRSR